MENNIDKYKVHKKTFNELCDFMQWDNLDNLGISENIIELNYSWLMLVVEKIQTITTFDIRYCRTETDEIYTECTTFKHGHLIANENPLIAIYEKCLNFIEMYNMCNDLENLKKDMDQLNNN